MIRLDLGFFEFALQASPIKFVFHEISGIGRAVGSSVSSYRLQKRLLLHHGEIWRL